MTPLGARCTILGGTNGSGKSSIFQSSPSLLASGEFVNADVVARSLSPDRPETVSAAAGRAVIGRLSELIAARRDFVLETTLSSKQSIQLMKTARAAGYYVGLVFVVLRHVDLNVYRVHERASRGGHSIPDDTIRRRYGRALANLPVALRLSHEAAVYDNSSISPVVLVELSGGNIEYASLDKADPTHGEIATAVGAALSISTDAVWRASR